MTYMQAHGPDSHLELQAPTPLRELSSARRGATSRAIRKPGDRAGTPCLPAASCQLKSAGAQLCQRHEHLPCTGLHAAPPAWASGTHGPADTGQTTGSHHTHCALSHSSVRCVAAMMQRTLSSMD